MDTEALAKRYRYLWTGEAVSAGLFYSFVGNQRGSGRLLRQLDRSSLWSGRRRVDLDAGGVILALEIASTSPRAANVASAGRPSVPPVQTSELDNDWSVSTYCVSRMAGDGRTPQAGRYRVGVAICSWSRAGAN